MIQVFTSQERFPLRASDRNHSAFAINMIGVLGLLRRLDPFGLGDSKGAWLMYREQTWIAVAQQSAAASQAVDALRAAPPLAPGLRLNVMVHEQVGGIFGPSSSLAQHQALEQPWRAAQAALAAEVPGSVLLVAPHAGHLIAADAPEFVAAQIAALTTLPR